MDTRQRDTQHEAARHLVRTLEQDGFLLYKQPFTPLGSEGGEGVGRQNVYVRFAEEEEKRLPPGGFISVLESLDLMHLLDRWVVRRVVHWFAGMQQSDPRWKAVSSSISLSERSLTNPAFEEYVALELQKRDMDGAGLDFAIEERAAHANAGQIKRFTRGLRRLGCSFTLASYTGDLLSAEWLRDCQFERVKLDVAIVSQMHRDRASLEKAKTIQRSCERAGIRTVAEYVDCDETLSHLRNVGVNYAHGAVVACAARL